MSRTRFLPAGPFRSRDLGRRSVRSAALVALLGVATSVPDWNSPGRDSETTAHLPVSAGRTSPSTSSPEYGWLFDPAFSSGFPAAKLGSDAPLETAFRQTSGLQVASADPVPTAAVPAPAEPLQPIVAPTAELVPLPVPRPPEFMAPKTAEASRLAGHLLTRRTKTAAVPGTPEDNRSFFEKLFGLPASSPTPGVTYAALKSDAVVPPAPVPRLSPSPDTAWESATAVYDISARVVRLPNGETLEAHSGLGEKLDDARFVHVRMRGATPPGTYELTEREQLFHGVRALRLTPVGGNGEVFGRAGLLAHTFMLGPKGDSNGCVSFRDYDRFLQAFLRGEVKRLVVVAGRAQDRAPSIADRLFGRSGPRANDA